MKSEKFLHPGYLTGGLALALALAACAPSAHGNVYATNIKLNGSLLTNITVLPASSVSVSYILNEPAPLGVTLTVLSNTTVVRTISVAGGNPGTTRGTNTVVWDGKDNSSLPVLPGTYSVNITAKTSGYTNWTQISNDADSGNYVFSPRGVAVNVNSNSPYYGRVFAGSPRTGPNPGTVPGDKPGIVKLNADSSFADEGQSTGGYNWIDDGFDDSPHQLRYGMDDRVYALDWTGPGVIVACDNIMSTNQVVLPQSSYASNPYHSTVTGGNGWNVFEVTDADTTHGRLWLADNDFPSAGVWVWHMVNGVADPSDTVGTQAVATGGDVSLVPQGGLVVDDNSDIFVGQGRSGYGQSANRVVCFTNWDGTNVLSTGAAWVAGSLDDTFRGGYDLTIDSRSNPKYIAMPLSVSAAPAGPGGIRLLNSADGSVVVSNLDSGSFYYASYFDNVGNLYGVSSIRGVPLPVMITPAVSSGVVSNSFTGPETPVAFTLVSASAVTGPYSPAVGATLTELSTGLFSVTLPTNGPKQFYRISRSGFHGLRVFSPPSGTNQATTIAFPKVRVQGLVTALAP